jgi:hypothetical protein
MFIEKARYLEQAQAIGGIVIDQHLSLKSANGALFSMTGDGNNDVNIPLVLMFKDQALQLFNLLSKQPKLIVYLGDENYLRNSFYQQLDYLESLIEPLDQTTEKWFYGQMKFFKKQCAIVPKKLKSLEFIIHQQVERTSKSF